VVDKGSVAVDGVSLTVGESGKDSFKIFIIPHTMKETTIGMLRRGGQVNVEFDMIGKYVLGNLKAKIKNASDRILRDPERSKLNEKFLTEKGFI
jgi:riboflavin synthase